MIRRPPRSTQSRSSAASDVYKRQVVRRAHRLGYPSGRGWPAEKAASVFADRRAVDDDGLDTPLPYLLRDAQRFAHRVCRAAHGDVASPVGDQYEYRAGLGVAGEFMVEDLIA